MVHPIDERSPLHDLDAGALAEASATFVLTLTGIDDTLGQTVHARRSWTHLDVAWNRRFADIISDRPDGGRRIDYTRFHETEPLPPRG